MRRLALVIAAVLATACATTPRPPERAPTLAVPVTCAPQCTVSCVPVQWPQWQGDPAAPATWDRIDSDVIAPLRAALERCDGARAACVQCLRRIERAGVVCGIAERC
jgi:hypothetical protein